VATRRKVGNLLALPLLSLLTQGPQYPYEMAQTLKARGKDQSVQINWGSLYTVVRNLEKHGFIEAASTEREGRQPERTTYRITEAGRAELVDWLRELIGVPEDLPTPFETALAEAAILSPAELVALLTRRLATLDEANAAHQGDLATWVQRLPRLLLIESEYLLAMRIAQAGWVRGILAEITSGALADLDAWQRQLDTGIIPADLLELEAEARDRVRKEWEDQGNEP
jgi:DNA-binding PadR family transcriptional regulator